MFSTQCKSCASILSSVRVSVALTTVLLAILESQWTACGAMFEYLRSRYDRFFYLHFNYSEEAFGFDTTFSELVCTNFGYPN